MQTITSQRVRTKFGVFSNLVKSREPIVITQHKRPTMLVLSYAEGMEALRLSAKMRLLERLEQEANTLSPCSDAELEGVVQLIEQEREILYQNSLINTH